MIEAEPIIIPVKEANGEVGIKIRKNSVEIYIPQVFRQNKDKMLLCKDLLLFLKSMEIAKTVNEVEIKKDNDNIGVSWPIDSYLWIIRDYLENGYYYNREKMYSNSYQGKIEWKKTLKTVPIYSDGNIIYDKLVTSKMSASNDIVAQIYKICLKRSINHIGWAFNYNLIVDIQQKKSVQEMVYVITKQLNETFDDEKRLRFRHMLKILKGIENNNALSSDCTYTINNYYYVFEVMVDKLLQGIDGKEKEMYNPSGFWQLNNKKAFESSNLRPDTIYKEGNKTYIIDAKMYQYGYTHSVTDLPKTSSMQKQITYGDFVHNYVDKESKIRNAFVLPFDKERFMNDPNVEFSNDNNLAFIGKAYVNYRNKREPMDYDNIYAFMVDFNFLLNNYNKNDCQYINNLCEKINEKL